MFKYFSAKLKNKDSAESMFDIPPLLKDSKGVHFYNALEPEIASWVVYEGKDTVQDFDGSSDTRLIVLSRGNYVRFSIYDFPEWRLYNGKSIDDRKKIHKSVLAKHREEMKERRKTDFFEVVKNSLDTDPDKKLEKALIKLGWKPPKRNKRVDKEKHA